MIQEAIYPPQRPTEPDVCAGCDRPLQVKPKDLAYRGMKDKWSLVLLSNKCSAECVEAVAADPDGTAARLRERLNI